MKETAFFTNLYLQYYPAALQYALRYCEGKCSAEDIVQNVFVKLLQKEAVIMEVGNWNSYLFIMVRNEAMDYFRRENMQKQLITESMRRNIQISTHDKLIEKEYKELHKAAIEKLPRRQQEIYRLRFELGLKREDIAKVLSISPFTVKNQLKRAKEVVRDAMKQVA